MATSRPFTYNTDPNTPIPGTTEEVEGIAIGYPSVSGWTTFMGPNENNRYIICKPIPAGNQPTPDGKNNGTVAFWASQNETDESFLQLVNSQYRQYIPPGDYPFLSAIVAKSFLNNTMHHWTSYGET